MGKKQKVQFVWVLRHAKAYGLDPQAGYRADIARALSPEGVEQAEARKRDFEEVPLVAVAATPAVRGVQTAARIAGCAMSDVDLLATLLAPNSKNGKDAHHINFLFENMGYSPLSGYRIALEDADVMDRYGRKTWPKVRGYLRKKNPGNILIVGHAVLTAQTFYSAISGNKAEHTAMRRTFLNAVMGEAGGFRLKFVNLKLVEVVELPPPGEGFDSIKPESDEEFFAENAEGDNSGDAGNGEDQQTLRDGGGGDDDTPADPPVATAPPSPPSGEAPVSPPPPPPAAPADET